MVVFEQIGFDPAKVVVLLYYYYICSIRSELLYSYKFVVFGQKWLYSAKRGSVLAKVVVFGQKLLYSRKVVVFRQSGCIRAEWL